MNRRTKVVAVGASVAALAAGGAGVAIAGGGGDDTEAPIKGSDLEQASAAALEHTGEGAVSDTCLLYTSPSPRDRTRSRMPSSA